MLELFNWLFGCRHSHQSKPTTDKQGTYIVCLTCGREFGYDWRTLRVTKGKRFPADRQEEVTPA